MLEIRNLYKMYGKMYALNNLNLSISKGELFGFVGPNGAGKTTTMKIMAGLLEADGGQVFIDGIDALQNINLLKSKIGYVPDFFGVYDNLTAMEYMLFYASTYGIEGAKAKELCVDLMKLVNLEDKEEAMVDSLSRGMKQRLCLARSLIHNPELLILDEPASGLDPRARFEIKGILKNLCEMGKTIIISSHILPELAEMCTSVGIIQNGQMILSGTVTEIIKNFNSSNPVVVKVAYGKEEAMMYLKENPMVESVSTLENRISIGFHGGDCDVANLLDGLVRAGAGVSYFAREEGNLESLFMQITNNGGGIVG